jgi:molybdenum cofactor biosynthesis protein B
MSPSKSYFKVAVLTVSNAKRMANDESGKYLRSSIRSKHCLLEHQFVKDDVYHMRAVVSRWIANSKINVIITTGGTGFGEKDVTYKAIEPLLDKKITGFGELFRQLTYHQVGSSVIQTRSMAGLSNDTIIFCLPSSLNACKKAWEEIIAEQLDENAIDGHFIKQYSIN